MAISITVQPRDQMSAAFPYPRGPWSMISGAIYCRVPRPRIGTTMAAKASMSPSSAGYLHHPREPITSNSGHHTPLSSVIVHLGPVTCQASVSHARRHGVSFIGHRWVPPSATCESLCARRDACQPLGGAKVRNLEQSTEGVDQYVVPLIEEDTGMGYCYKPDTHPILEPQMNLPRLHPEPL